MGDPKQRKNPSARETAGEGAAKRNRKESAPSAEEKADPQRDREAGDARLIDRRRDARNPEGL